MKALFAAASLCLFLVACGDGDTPCDQLQLCCDALISDPETRTSCIQEDFPTDDAVCTEQLELLPDFIAEEEPVPEDCLLD